MADYRPFKQRRVEREAPQSLRLVVDSIHYPLEKLVVLSAGERITVGRDRAPSRLRLKDMSTSKEHASIFYLEEYGQESGDWVLQDCGSTQGTFVTRAQDGDVIRMSEPKQSSEPMPLCHLEFIFLSSAAGFCSFVLSSVIRIGDNTITVHLHPQLPCAECGVKSAPSNLIDLNAAAPPKAKEPEQPVHISRRTLSKNQRTQMQKDDMRNLKAALLNKPQPSSSNKSQYVDRAAIRRQNIPEPLPQVEQPKAEPPPPPEPVSEQSRYSKGHAMLAKMSAASDAPSTLTGDAIVARTMSSGTSHAGLGSRTLVTSEEYAASKSGGDDWKKQGRESSYKRYHLA